MVKNNSKPGNKIWAWVAVAATVVVGLVVGIMIVTSMRGEEDEFSSGCSNYNGVDICPVDKPIIYLYPTKTTTVSVELGNPENLLYSYPIYENGGWEVLAEPDGKLTDTKTGKELYSLYWEGKNYSYDGDFSEGFYVSKEEIVPFLEEKLEVLGLNYREKEEFIIYWLPRLSEYEHLFIRFASLAEIEGYMPLNITPKPDNLIRILMQFKGLEKPMRVEKQELSSPSREGFTVVEWGGTEIK